MILPGIPFQFHLSTKATTSFQWTMQKHFIIENLNGSKGVARENGVFCVWANDVHKIRATFE